ncbi:MAG TPA: glycosyltransferase family 4 protein [Euzebyales bacterium]|nr:glycosyltransferase family 4 protein [Euzebyales bacterium]
MPPLDAATDRLLCLSRTFNVPLRYILGPLQEHVGVRVLLWGDVSPDDWESPSEVNRDSARQYAREVRVGRRRTEREYPFTVTLVSPRMLWDLLRAPERVVLARELNVATLYAVLSKVRSGRRVVSLVEGDFSLLGTTGKAGFKVALRRLTASFVDVFVSNSQGATRYLTDVLGVPRRRIVEGWWLAGLPQDREITAPAPAPRHAGERPVFLAAGQFIPRKGFDLLLDGIARYHADVGPCRLQLVGDGPQRAELMARAQRLDIEGDVEFLGTVPHAQMSKLFQSCDVFVFPTLFDLVGRVAVEALSAGTPVAASRLSGAADVLVRDGVNGVLMDPRDPASIADALRRGADPATNARLREGARATGADVTPEAAARRIAHAVALADRTPPALPWTR